MFVVTGGQVLPKVLRAIMGQGEGPNQVLATAMLLNIALILLGWMRFRELAREVIITREQAAEARGLAETDPLTGCLNRRSINDAGAALLMRVRQEHGALAVAMLDLDNFKHVNDLHSHQAGDAILRTAADRLRGILPQGAILARIGGDEFACILPFDPRRPDPIEQLCSDIVNRVAECVEWNGMAIEATVSLGLSRSDEDANDDLSTLLHKADIAMFHAKRQGRNQIAWFTPAMESELRFRGELEAGIRRGVSAGEFVPYYEKQIDLATGELVGFEMLARWMSPTLGKVGPDIFIPVAEEIGAIAELSESVIRQALRDARAWDPKLTLAVNISPVQLRDPWFAQKLLKLLVEANFPPHRLEIEITESSLHENVGLVRSMITSLKNQGIRVSLDDFGTGYSSLAQLRSLPFDRIKIDRSFISSMPESEENRTIVKSIVALGQGLGMPVTAEGVESEEVLAALGGYDGLKAQGYLYGHPQPADITLEGLRQLHMTLERKERAAAEAPAKPQRARRA
ncbi:putative bifunctional diguanylate cyclase/phosphodiesterase [Novosphingobium ginsenosidimutans]|nr:EAL domain-containing protein [Novosphingobium ginsenosidimutans]